MRSSGLVLDSPAMPRSLRALLPVLLLLAVGAAGCGGGSGSPDETSATGTATPAQSAAQTVDAIARRISPKLSERPRIPAPQGQPPSRLIAKDVVRGTGKPVRQGQVVQVQYVGASWSTGKEFDASWNRGQAFSFPLGGGQVIPGWDKGVVGMRPGGRRLLVITPDLGYGAQGTPDGSIAPNETLLFVIDLQQAK